MLRHLRLLVTISLLPLCSFSQLTLTGTVKSKKTIEPLAGAIIHAEGSFIHVQSDANGQFSIPHLKPGTIVITAKLLGYETYRDTISLTENKSIEILLQENPVMMDEIKIVATRANENSAMSYTNVSREQLEKVNLGQDLPLLLNTLPSVVTTSDAGAGIGYTGIRIRGSDATRINVTINGIPVNDAESQGTFWVDLPDIASSIDNIQVQRGVGTSTNGAGAFGGSLNIQTTKLQSKPYAEINSSIGSFNTFKNTLNMGTGLLNNHWSIDARLSKITSDGYIDRAFSDLKSYYLSGAYYGKNATIKAIHFSGTETTYQAWNGVPEARLKGDIQGINDYITQNGLSPEEGINLLTSPNRTANLFTYRNQTDNYRQDYYQLHFSYRLNDNWNANAALHYTKGKGYYEEYKTNASLTGYAIAPIITGNDTITSSDLIRRQWLDNDFYGTTFSFNYNNHKKLTATIGGAANRYNGQHYGEVIWARYAGNSNINHRYYHDTATKTDINLFARANYQAAKIINVFLDLQGRTVLYSFLGYNSNLQNVRQQTTLDFFNPKAGITINPRPALQFYASYSMAAKEPNRNDFTQSTPQSRPRHEQLQDIEAGYKHQLKMARWGINGYYMRYKNQLVLTGKVNDVGAYNRVNVNESYRAGIEAEAAVKFLNRFTLEANLTLSKNKISGFEEYLDDYDNGGQQKTTYQETDIAFSPEMISATTLTYEPCRYFSVSYIQKMVSAQYLDNTSNALRKINGYIVSDMRIGCSFETKTIKNITFTLMVNNLWNTLYESNGYTYGWISGQKRWDFNHYYPQAGTNFLAGITLKF